MSTLTLHCQRCGTPVLVSREAVEAALRVTPEQSRAEAIEALIVTWRTWCRESGRHITPDYRVAPAVAAELTGLSEGTLKNRRCRGQRPYFVHVGKLVKYTLHELADWITACDA